jgi:hypothetical protein
VVARGERLRSERSPTDTIPARRLLGRDCIRTVICERDSNTGRGTKARKYWKSFQWLEIVEQITQVRLRGSTDCQPT